MTTSALGPTDLISKRTLGPASFEHHILSPQQEYNGANEAQRAGSRRHRTHQRWSWVVGPVLECDGVISADCKLHLPVSCDSPTSASQAAGIT
ncbi:hypothetical protein AAY473_025186, partial [Plecturocebus cupreus]